MNQRILLASMFLVLYGAAALAPVTAPDFTVAMLPDTQFYSQFPAYYPSFTGQTGWIAAHRTSERILFATQVGDVVQNGASGSTGNLAEWQRADAAIALLGDLPHSVALGNHDFDTVSDKSASTRFEQFFGPQRYAGQSWFLGASPDDRNFAQVFTHSGQPFLHVALEWRASDSALAWAMEVLRAHPRVPTILSTHEHLQVGNPGPRSTGGQTPDSGGDNSAVDVFEKLVEPFPQVFLVLSGHFHGNGRRTSVTRLGRTVHEVLADFQSDPNGGNGWMQLLRFHLDRAELTFETFSPTYVPGSSPGPNRALDPASNFTLPLDLVGLRDDLDSSFVVRLREGQPNAAGPYSSTRDTYLGSGAAGSTLPGQSQANATSLVADGDGDQEVMLLAFDNLIGTASGQVPPGASIARAVLTLTTEGTGAESAHGGRLHRMLVGWGEASTWDSLGAGVQLGLECDASIDASSTGQVGTKGTRSFDVTGSVQAWSNGAVNHGWAVFGVGSDEWRVRSSEWATLAERPQLTVVVLDPCPAPRSRCVSNGNSFTPGGARIDAVGSTSLAAASLSLVASGIPPGKSGIFLVGASAAQTAFGDGYLCIASPIARISPPLSSDSSGQLTLALDPQSGPLGAGPLALSPGVTRHFQLWFRDPQGPGGTGSNTTDSVEIQFCP
jgi:hypothetical protein